jgi:DNA-binding MarR family transcriptional regulator
MQRLHRSTSYPVTAEECAAQLAAFAPTMIRATRCLLHNLPDVDLSPPQVRALSFLEWKPGASLSALADYMGLTPSAVSRLADGLVRRGLVNRQESVTDRRFANLTLTPAGEHLLKAANLALRARLLPMVSRLSPAQQKLLLEAIEVLRGVFVPNSPLRYSDEEVPDIPSAHMASSAPLS